MKNLNFRYPFVIILVSVILGFFFNYKAGLSWEENLNNMRSQSKIVSYLLIFVVIFLWKNWRNFTKN